MKREKAWSLASDGIRNVIQFHFISHSHWSHCGKCVFIVVCVCMCVFLHVPGDGCKGTQGRLMKPKIQARVQPSLSVLSCPLPPPLGSWTGLHTQQEEPPGKAELSLSLSLIQLSHFPLRAVLS